MSLSFNPNNEELMSESNQESESKENITLEAVKISEATEKLDSALDTLIDILRTVHQPIASSSEHKLCELLKLIGNKVISNSCYNDGLTLQSLYKDKDVLANLNPVFYIKKHDQYLVSFLLGVTGIDIYKEKSKVTFSFAKCLEMIYYLRNMNLALPYSFVENLIQSYTSGSKTVSVVNSKTSPAGGYKTLNNWWNILGSVRLKCPPGCIDMYFDNVGRHIIKNYRVKSEKPAKSLVFTSGIHIILDSVSNIQYLETFKPINWIKYDLSTQHERMRKMLPEYDDLFRGLRNEFIEELLKKALQEHSTARGTGMMSNTYLPELSAVSFSGKRDITMMEPVFENPNSYENVEVSFHDMITLLDIHLDVTTHY